MSVFKTDQQNREFKLITPRFTPRCFPTTSKPPLFISASQSAARLISLLLMSVFVTAETGCIEGDCRSGTGTFIYDDGYQQYVGSWKNNKRHGQGKHQYADGRYEGQWKNGKRHGQGIYYHAEGHRYEGEWSNDQPDGMGIFQHVEGNIYEGQWKKGAQDGQGTLHSADGSRYEGEWKDGNKHGQGEHWHSNGNHYQGMHRDNEPDGYGILAPPVRCSDIRLTQTNTPKPSAVGRASYMSPY